VTADRLEGRKVGFRAPVGANFSRLLVIQIGSEAHTDSYQMVTGAFSSGVKRPGCEADHSSLTSADVKNKPVYVYTATTPYVLMA
jgi:hypothetical protein